MPISTRKRVLQTAMRKLNDVAPGTYERLKRSFFERSSQAQLLQAALAGLPITSITVTGAQGTFEGSAADVSVIQRYAIDGCWSPTTIALIRDFFGPAKAGTYVDIGANIGLTAVPVAASGINTIAFEAVPANARYLHRNAEANGAASHIDIVDAALLDKAGEVTFELSPTNHGDHRFRNADEIALMDESAWATVVVTAHTLDSFADRIVGPLAMKIDVQGAEPLVFAGGRSVFDRVDLLICEISPYAMARMQVNPRDFFAYLGSFAAIQVFEREAEDGGTSYSGATIVPFLEKFHADNVGEPYGRYVNLVATRK